eukprot:SAG11_NODE_3899_length_2158_cov_2.615347_4_plen_99_part_01
MENQPEVAPAPLLATPAPSEKAIRVAKLVPGGATESRPPPPPAPGTPPAITSDQLAALLAQNAETLRLTPNLPVPLSIIVTHTLPAAIHGIVTTSTCTT